VAELFTIKSNLRHVTNKPAPLGNPEDQGDISLQSSSDILAHAA
jgi:hypothetical protein